jgi:flagellar biosynthetic protein FlhB
LSESAGDKKHDATPYRRQKAREQGQIARSQDLGSALVLLCAVMILGWWGPTVLRTLADIMVASLTQTDYWTTSSRSAAGLINVSFLQCLLAVLPIMLSVCAVVLVNNWMQVGFLFLPDKLNLDWSRVNPLSGMKRLFALPNIARIGFGLLKIGLVTLVMALGIWGRWELILGAQQLTAGEVAALIWSTTLDMCMRTAGVLLVLSIFDYGFQWWKIEQDLKMTDDEMRDEMKMMNGDPQIAAKRRAFQRQLMMNRIQSTVPKADVVITNPTELAIAIQFDPKTMPAPIVLAKGAGEVAARIRKIALEHGVPVVERKPLAQALYKHVEIGQIVPVDQYKAVAEVLRYVYQLQGKKLPSLDP